MLPLSCLSHCSTTVHSTGRILKSLILTGQFIIIIIIFSEQVMFIVLCVFLCRFTAEEKAMTPQLCYMPFGFGPRSCLAMRLALLEAKIALIELLKRYTFIRAPETKVGRLRTLSYIICSLISEPIPGYSVLNTGNGPGDKDTICRTFEYSVLPSVSVANYLSAGAPSAWPDHETKEWYSPQSHETILMLYKHLVTYCV